MRAHEKKMSGRYKSFLEIILYHFSSIKTNCGYKSKTALLVLLHLHTASFALVAKTKNSQLLQQSCYFFLWPTAKEVLKTPATVGFCVLCNKQYFWSL